MIKYSSQTIFCASHRQSRTHDSSHYSPVSRLRYNTPLHVRLKSLTSNTLPNACTTPSREKGREREREGRQAAHPEAGSLQPFERPRPSPHHEAYSAPPQSIHRVPRSNKRAPTTPRIPHRASPGAPAAPHRATETRPGQPTHPDRALHQSQPAHPSAKLQQASRPQRLVRLVCFPIGTWISSQASSPRNPFPAVYLPPVTRSHACC